MTGQGYDCQFGISGSYSGLGTILPKSRKQDFAANKFMLKDGSGTTVGYKYFDFNQSMTLEFMIAAVGPASTGTVAATVPAIGATCTVTDTVYTQGAGTWSIDKFSTNVAPGEGLMATVEMSRFTGTTVV